MRKLIERKQTGGGLNNLSLNVNIPSFNTSFTTTDNMGKLSSIISSKGTEFGSSSGNWFDLKDMSPEQIKSYRKNLGMNLGFQIAGGIVGALPSADREVNSLDASAGQIRGSVNQALMSSGNPYAMAAGLANSIIEKTGGFTDASKGLGKGTDAANLAASFLLPGAGWFTGKTRDIEADQMVMASSGYTGTAANVQDAQQNANAKLLFGRNKANKIITEADNKQKKARNILNQGIKDRYASANPLTASRIQLQMSGGYNPVVAAKEGSKLYNRNEAQRILKQKNHPYMIVQPNEFDDGGKLKQHHDSVVEYVKKQNPRFIQRMYEPVRYVEWTDKNGNKYKGTHLMAYHPTEDGKAIIYPEISEDYMGRLVKWDNPDKARERAIEMLDYVELPIEDAKWFTENNYKSYFPEFFGIDKFREGGSFNVIPEGALHKNRHHLEDIDDKYKDVTTKGIPVISEDKNGDITQHAEVEKEEIIFRLEVTKKLEELAKENTDEAAIEAGKLLVQEILYNTIDKTNNLL